MSTWQYIVDHREEILLQTEEHLLITLTAIALATAVGVSLGILITRKPWMAKGILGLVGIIQTIPSLALLGFMLPLLGIGTLPAVVALFLYALLPIVSNTYIGITNISKPAVEAAIGMGMTRSQILRYVELPLALPTILTGIKTATVINVGVATLCAFIGAGGLGQLIFRGISLNNTPMILAGAIPASFLAISLDAFLGLVQRHYKSKMLWIGLFVVAAIWLAVSLWPERSPTSSLTAGFNSEFIERADGFVRLDSTYNLPLTIKEMEIGLMYQALHEGKVDVIDGFSTDGRIKAYDLKLLKDDQQYFPPYEAAPIVNNATLTLHPQLRQVINMLKITNDEMVELNYEVDQNKTDLQTAAFDFLQSKGLQAHKGAGHSDSPHIVIGSKAFTENYLMAHLFAQLIEGNTNLQTKLILGFGGTKIIFEALKAKEIDMYVEYTGTGLLVLLDEKYTPDATPSETYQRVKKGFQHQYNITWMEPIGFNNTFALMMRRNMADSLNIHTISDLSDHLHHIK
ncbi:ABC transporter permease/substrate-binding protein [Marinoscillum furvescens]|uniref:Osmoprotectant transport system permease protein n=1 Tax=Marinoscillum furvescens DSM 4134 TaxID=1122208 RepID=A0A3D9L8Z4_MARFU|nr:ABC transporter permease/substrate-binding protein [Marinoscillum furvescens]REE02154.1 osmoprotectant transport system permease protein [Marinoscillum furvescens DSM 4134]